MVAKLSSDRELEAKRLIASGPPFDPAAIGLERHAVYLSYEEVVFVFEGPEVESVVAEIVDDPWRSTVFSAWSGLVRGAPRIAREAYFWDRGASDG